MSMLQVIQLVAVVTGFTAALTLFYGSIGVPWQLQSWGGQTSDEQRWRRRQAIMKWIGMPAATISALSQSAAIFWPANWG